LSVDINSRTGARNTSLGSIIASYIMNIYYDGSISI